MILITGLKNFLREPRPMFIESGLMATDCGEMEFGNPSGHSLGMTTMVFSSVYLMHRHCTFTRK